MIQSPKFLIEFYVNYDCNIGQFNLVEKIIELLGKIAQGKYSKSDFSQVIQPDQDQILRKMSIESLTSILTCLDKLLEEIESNSQSNENRFSEAHIESSSSEINASDITFNGDNIIMDPEMYKKNEGK